MPRFFGEAALAGHAASITAVAANFPLPSAASRYKDLTQPRPSAFARACRSRSRGGHADVRDARAGLSIVVSATPDSLAAVKHPSPSHDTPGKRRANPLLSGGGSPSSVCRRASSSIVNSSSAGSLGGNPLGTPAGAQPAALGSIGGGTEHCRFTGRKRPMAPDASRWNLGGGRVSLGNAEDKMGDESVKRSLAGFARLEFTRSPAEGRGDSHAQRKRIRKLEREKASIQRQHQASKMSLAQGELVLQTLVSQVDSLQREIVQQREELDTARKMLPGLCVVCTQDAASHVVVPCGHLALCQSCSGLARSRCPMCWQEAGHIICVRWSRDTAGEGAPA